MEAYNREREGLARGGKQPGQRHCTSRENASDPIGLEKGAGEGAREERVGWGRPQSLDLPWLWSALFCP